MAFSAQHALFVSGAAVLVTFLVLIVIIRENIGEVRYQRGDFDGCEEEYNDGWCTRLGDDQCEAVNGSYVSALCPEGLYCCVPTSAGGDDNDPEWGTTDGDRGSSMRPYPPPTWMPDYME